MSLKGDLLYSTEKEIPDCTQNIFIKDRVQSKTWLSETIFNNKLCKLENRILYRRFRKLLSDFIMTTVDVVPL
jgi:hypothetical protein